MFKFNSLTWRTYRYRQCHWLWRGPWSPWRGAWRLRRTWWQRRTKWREWWETWQSDTRPGGGDRLSGPWLDTNPKLNWKNQGSLLHTMNEFSYKDKDKTQRTFLSISWQQTLPLVKMLIHRHKKAAYFSMTQSEFWWPWSTVSLSWPPLLLRSGCSFGINYGIFC